MMIFNNLQYLFNLVEKYSGKKEYEKDLAEIYELIIMISNFHEHVWFFPVSVNVMIILINPLYKKLQLHKQLSNKIISENFDKYHTFSRINMKYLMPNLVNYKNQEQINLDINQGIRKPITEYYHDDDKYIYQIHNLDSETIQYVNTLMLDRVGNFFGFKNKAKIRRSIEFYQNYPAKKLNNYSKLLSKLNEEMI